MTSIQKERVNDKKNNYAIINIPNGLRDEVKTILPKEKPSKTIGLLIVLYLPLSINMYTHQKEFSFTDSPSDVYLIMLY